MATIPAKSVKTRQNLSMAVPQTQKRVGAGGCIASILVFVLSAVVFFGGIFWSISSIVGVLTNLANSPSIPLGGTSTINVNSTGDQWLLLSNVENKGSSLPFSNPSVSVTDPSGNSVNVVSSASTSGSDGASEFRSIGYFTATTTGAYEISVGGSSSSSAKVYVASVDLSGAGMKLAIGIGVGFLLFIVSIILAIVWLVRRSKNKKSSAPPYQGGAYGGPPPGPPGGGYGAPPSGPPGGGYGAPPPGPPGYGGSPPVPPPPGGTPPSTSF